MKLVMLSARVPEELRTRARHVALDLGISVQQLVERAVREFLERVKGKRAG